MRASHGEQFVRRGVSRPYDTKSPSAQNNQLGVDYYWVHARLTVERTKVDRARLYEVE